MSNYWFAIYYIYYKRKRKIIEFTYNFYLFYRFDLVKTIGMQTDNLLMLINNIFANNKEKIIKVVKVITKNCKYLTSTDDIKSNKI